MLVHAPKEQVDEHLARWATVTSVDASTCRVEMDGRQARWAAFGLGVLEAPFTIEEAPEEVLELLGRWGERFSSAAGPH